LYCPARGLGREKIAEAGLPRNLSLFRSHWQARQIASSLQPAVDRVGNSSLRKPLLHSSRILAVYNACEFCAITLPNIWSVEISLLLHRRGIRDSSDIGCCMPASQVHTEAGNKPSLRTSSLCARTRPCSESWCIEQGNRHCL
jgi:hypothetical protein